MHKSNRFLIKGVSSSTVLMHCWFACSSIVTVEHKSPLRDPSQAPLGNSLNQQLLNGTLRAMMLAPSAFCVAKSSQIKGHHQWCTMAWVYWHRVCWHRLRRLQE